MFDKFFSQTQEMCTQLSFSFTSSFYLRIKCFNINLKRGIKCKSNAVLPFQFPACRWQAQATKTQTELNQLAQNYLIVTSYS